MSLSPLQESGNRLQSEATWPHRVRVALRPAVNPDALLLLPLIPPGCGELFATLRALSVLTNSPTSLLVPTSSSLQAGNVGSSSQLPHPSLALAYKYLSRK